LWAKGWSGGEDAEGAEDRRTGNGMPRADADLCQALAEMLRHLPTHYWWQRPN